MIFDNPPQMFKCEVLLFLSMKAVLLLLRYYQHHIFDICAEYHLALQYLGLLL